MQIHFFRPIQHTPIHFAHCNCCPLNAWHNLQTQTGSQKPKETFGLDKIPRIVLKKAAPELASIFTKIFHTPYNKDIFPDSMKTGRVQSVLGKGSKTLPSNCNPISLLPVFREEMEFMINSHALKYPKTNKLIYDRQYGFRQEPIKDLSLIDR